MVWCNKCLDIRFYSLIYLIRKETKKIRKKLLKYGVEFPENYRRFLQGQYIALEQILKQAKDIEKLPEKQFKFLKRNKKLYEM